MVISEATKFGALLGSQANTANKFKEDFQPSEAVADITLTGLETEESNNYIVLRKKSIIGCSELPFVIDHPVHGNIDSPLYYIDGDYCSSLISEISIELVQNIIDESTNFLVDESDNNIINIGL
ncbi:MAG: hypothetical protein DRI61_17415 [Chloroflexi bacterium]|nr:MAG: hypothetical protein DRI61_17415 [Chloroflexota bacterium]